MASQHLEYERFNTGRNASANSKELTTTVMTLITKLEATHKELATEHQRQTFLSRRLENAAARLQQQKKAKWRRVLCLLLTILLMLSAATGAAAFAAFLWLYYRGVITF